MHRLQGRRSVLRGNRSKEDAFLVIEDVLMHRRIYGETAFGLGSGQSCQNGFRSEIAHRRFLCVAWPILKLLLHRIIPTHL
jgi:hypothetical protein